MLKEELRDVDGSDSLHPNRSGDVVVVLRPPYQFDAATPGQRIALQPVLRPARLPAGPRRPRRVGQHARDVRGLRPGHQARGRPGRRTCARSTSRRRSRSCSGIPGPQNARGRILYELTKSPDEYKEITILDISDYHGQLVPLPRRRTTCAAPAVNPTFADRRLGVPQAVVRLVPHRGARTARC